MTERLGNVLYWIGCICAAIMVGCGAVMGVVMVQGTNTADHAAAPWVALAIAGSGLVPWGFGRACRYILSGY